MSDRLTRDRAADPSAYVDAGYPSGPPIEQKHLLDYVRVLYKERALVATVFLLVVSAVVAHAYLATPRYQARVQLLIEDERPNVIIFKEAAETDKTSIDYYQTQYRILQSETMARRTLDALGLWNHPEFNDGRVRIDLSIRRARPARRSRSASVGATRRRRRRQQRGSASAPSCRRSRSRP